MEIFGKHLFGEDADAFINLPIMEQVAWIKKRTKQQNDNIIDEFLSNIKNNDSKECLNCGQNGNNISERISEPIKEINVTNFTEVSSGVSAKRRGNNKKPKRTGF